MNTLTPVDRVSQLLLATTFRSLDVPITVAGLKFEANAAFVGTNRHSDLVVVFDCATFSDRRILRCVEGLSRALDVMESRRPLTVIVVGPVPSANILGELTKYGRILAVGSAASEAGDTALRDSVAALLPLELPGKLHNLESPLAELEGKFAAKRFESSLLRAARTGNSKLVEGAFIKALESALISPPDEPEEPNA